MGLKRQGPESVNNKNPVWHLVRSSDQGEGLTWEGMWPQREPSHTCGTGHLPGDWGGSQAQVPDGSPQFPHDLFSCLDLGWFVVCLFSFAEDGVVLDQWFPKGSGDSSRFCGPCSGPEDGGEGAEGAGCRGSRLH